jgi:hypothetical protein
VRYIVREIVLEIFLNFDRRLNCILHQYPYKLEEYFKIYLQIFKELRILQVHSRKLNISLTQLVLVHMDCCKPAF